MQRTPAGLASELIDGAMQQAPQPGRQSICLAGAQVVRQGLAHFPFSAVEHE
jgi:hypothetical protein